MAYQNVVSRMDYTRFRVQRGVFHTDYSQIVKNINSCGMTRLKRYCTTKQYPVRNFDKDIEILKYTLRYGPTAASMKYDVPTSRASTLLIRYNDYALKALAALA